MYRIARIVWLMNNFYSIFDTPSVWLAFLRYIKIEHLKEHFKCRISKTASVLGLGENPNYQIQANIEESKIQAV